MLCALTVRTLKPGTFEEFREAFSPNGDPRKMSARWVRFNMIRSSGNPDEVVCFGFFNGTVNELRRDADQSGMRISSKRSLRSSNPRELMASSRSSRTSTQRLARADETRVRATGAR